MREASLWIRRSVEIMQMQMTRCSFDFFLGKNFSTIQVPWGLAEELLAIITVAITDQITNVISIVIPLLASKSNTGSQVIHRLP